MTLGLDLPLGPTPLPPNSGIVAARPRQDHHDTKGITVPSTIVPSSNDQPVFRHGPSLGGRTAHPLAKPCPTRSRFPSSLAWKPPTWTTALAALSAAFRAEGRCSRGHLRQISTAFDQGVQRGHLPNNMSNEHVQQEQCPTSMAVCKNQSASSPGIRARRTAGKDPLRAARSPARRRDGRLISAWPEEVARARRGGIAVPTRRAGVGSRRLPGVTPRPGPTSWPRPR